MVGPGAVEFRSMQEPLKEAFRYVRAQLEHLPVAIALPAGSPPQFPEIVRAFVVSLAQCERAAVNLVAGRAV